MQAHKAIVQFSRGGDLRRSPSIFHKLEQNILRIQFTRGGVILITPLLDLIIFLFISCVPGSKGRTSMENLWIFLTSYGTPVIKDILSFGPENPCRMRKKL